MSTLRDISWYQQCLQDGSTTALNDLLARGPAFNIDTWDLTQEWASNLLEWLHENKDNSLYETFIEYAGETLSNNARMNDWLDAIHILRRFPVITEHQCTSDFLQHLYNIQHAKSSNFLFVQAEYHRDRSSYAALLKQAIDGDVYPPIDYEYCFKLLLDIQHLYKNDIDYQAKAIVDILSYWSDQERFSPKITTTLQALDTPILYGVLVYSFRFEFGYTLEKALKEDPVFQSKVKALSNPDTFLKTVRVLTQALEHEEEHQANILEDDIVTSLIITLFKKAPKAFISVCQSLGVSLKPHDSREALLLCRRVLETYSHTSEYPQLPEGLANIQNLG